MGAVVYTKANQPAITPTASGVAAWKRPPIQFLSILTCRVPSGTVDMSRVGLRLPRCSQLDLQRVTPLLQRLVLRLMQGYLGVKDGGAFISQVAYFNQSRLR